MHENNFELIINDKFRSNYCIWSSLNWQQVHAQYLNDRNHNLYTTPSPALAVGCRVSNFDKIWKKAWVKIFISKCGLESK